jgi:hypothetical protein
MKKILYILALFTFNSIHAQQDNCSCQSADDYTMNLREGLMGLEYRNPLKGYSGNQFYGEWTKGELRFSNGNIISGIDLRYETYLDELLWLRDIDYKAGILNKEEVSGFSFYDPLSNQNISFVKRETRFPFDTEPVDRYLEILVQGELTLYAFRNVTKSPGDFSLINTTKYLLYAGDRSAIIRLSKRDLLRCPVIDKIKMKAVFRSNTVNVENNEEEMAWAVRLYNQQQETTK